MVRGAGQARAEGEAQAELAVAGSETTAQQLLPRWWRPGGMATAVAGSQRHEGVEVRGVRHQPHQRA
eukprot:8623902-Alexandrium_andersonii.AAC.1